eukprot:2282-Heterococcus_DN1.PRE.2
MRVRSSTSAANLRVLKYKRVGIDAYVHIQDKYAAATNSTAVATFLVYRTIYRCIPAVHDALPPQSVAHYVCYTFACQ